MICCGHKYSTAARVLQSGYALFFLNYIIPAMLAIVPLKKCYYAPNYALVITTILFRAKLQPTALAIDKLKKNAILKLEAEIYLEYIGI